MTQHSLTAELHVIEKSLDTTLLLANEFFETMSHNKISRDLRVLLCESVTSSSHAFVSKINDTHDVLKNICVNEERLSEFLKNITTTPKSIHDNRTVLFEDPNEIGKINTQYLSKFLADLPKEVSKVLDGSMSVENATKVLDEQILGLRRQIVPGGYKGLTARECFGNQTSGVAYTCDTIFITKIALPFIRDFQMRKKSIDKEVSDVCDVIMLSFRTMQSISYGIRESKELSKENVDGVNMYISRASESLISLLTFMAYAIIRKIDIFITNAENLNDLYEIRTMGKPSTTMTESGADISSTTDINSMDKVPSIIKGHYDKIAFTLRSYLESHGNIQPSVINDRLREYEDCNRYSSVIEAISDITSRVTVFREKIKEEYMSPDQVLVDLGLKNNFRNTFGDIFEELSDITEYTNQEALEDHIYTVMAALGDIHDMFEFTKTINTHLSCVFGTIKSEKNLWNTNPPIRNSVVISDVMEALDNLYINFSEFVLEIFSVFEKRCIEIDQVSETLLNDRPIVVRDTSTAANYLKISMESIMDDRINLSQALLEGVVSKYRQAVIQARYALITEAEMVETKNVENDSKKGKAPKVTEDPDKMTDDDKSRNAKASTDTKKVDVKSTKELIKKITGTLTEFFNKMLNHFTTFVSKKSQKNLEFIESNKDAILNRSFNGISLSIYPYNAISSQEIFRDITSVSTAIRSLTVENLNKLSDSNEAVNVLFSGMSIPSGMAVDEFLKNAYMVGKSKAKTVEKSTYSGAQLKKLADDMVKFCESFYADEYKKINAELEKLRNDTISKVKSFSVSTNENDSVNPTAINNLIRDVKMFSGALLTGYRNKGNDYMEALKQLIPKNRKPADPAKSAGDHENI